MRAARRWERTPLPPGVSERAVIVMDSSWWCLSHRHGRAGATARRGFARCELWALLYETMFTYLVLPKDTAHINIVKSNTVHAVSCLV